jgi:HSP20 family protein
MRLVRYSYPTFRSVTPAFSGFQRSPWSGLENQINNLFESALSDFGGASSSRFPVDLYEDQNNTYVRAALPGVSRDDINVEITDGYLTLSAARKSAEGDDKSAESFSFSRAVSVPDEVQTDKINATYENGVLTVTLPKPEAVKPKKVTVAVK